MDAVAILNPKAGGGRTAQVWTKVRADLPLGVEALETKGPGHAAELTRMTLKQGADTIIAFGGDGTINEVVNGFFENEELVSDHAALAIIPHGTASDFRRILALPLDAKRAARVMHNGERRMIDVMKVRYTDKEGRRHLRYSINVTSFGMGGLVARRATGSLKALGGSIGFLLATLRTAMTFSGNLVTLKLDDSKTVNAHITNVAIGNGQYHGGGMWVCPGAMIDDGLLDVTLIQRLTPFELLKSLPDLYNGGILSRDNVQAHRVKYLRAESMEPVFVEIDGEPAGRLPLEISVLPQTIRVWMP